METEDASPTHETSSYSRPFRKYKLQWKERMTNNIQKWVLSSVWQQRKSIDKELMLIMKIHYQLSIWNLYVKVVGQDQNYLGFQQR